MLKKYFSLIVVFALILQVWPPMAKQQVHAADPGVFNFVGESIAADQPRITTDPKVTLTGSVGNVESNSVSYSVYQVLDTKGNNTYEDDLIGQKNVDIKSSIQINNSSIKVFNVELFPGVNRITFKGNNGSGGAETSIYINYYNAPVFYDLIASLDGNKFTITEEGTTVVHSTISAGRATANVTIGGYAPNAQTVTVETETGSKSYNVSSLNNYQFSISPVALKQGKNLVKIKVKNATQTIETTREIAFYNGNVTFYDLNLKEDVTSGSTTVTSAVELINSPIFSVTEPDNVYVTGKVIIPNYLTDDQPVGAVDGVPDPHPNPNLQQDIHYKISPSTATGTGLFPTDSSFLPVGANDDDFFIYEFSAPLNTFNGLNPENNVKYSLQLTTFNYKKSAQEGTGTLSFTLQDTNASYISEINYLNGYKNGANYEALTGTSLEGANLFGVPFAMEVLIANPSDPDAELVDVTKISNSTGGSTPPVAGTHFDNVSSTLVNKILPGNIKREIIIFNKLPYEGTQTVELSIPGPSGTTIKKTVKFSMMFGPHVTYNSIFDDMPLSDDTNLDSGDRANAIVGPSGLNDFKGTINNVNNTSDIRYAPTVTLPQTVYFYINNIPVRLTEQSGGDPTKFQLLDTATNTERLKAFNMLIIGENELRFVYRGANNSYEKITKIFITPANLPVIPAEATLGIFPYSTGYTTPFKNDPNFPLSGTTYTTTQKDMNVFGTFDFIDLGIASSNVQTKVSSMITSGAAFKYIFKIERSSDKTPITWNLSKQFTTFSSTDPTVASAVINESASTPTDLSVRYDLATQTFSFIMYNEELSPIGTPTVYNFTVYNNGEGGSKVTYRMEVDPTSMPYKILRPILPAKGIVNKNFIEVVIDAPEGTDSVIIQKQVAEKFTYDLPEYTNTYRAYVNTLKVGKNEIEFTINRGDDTVESSFMIEYAPTNIPGAQYMETMKSSHKIFGGAVNLKFPSGTTLIRSDFNVPADLKTQVFTGHNLLFAIANPQDGVVDRRELEPRQNEYLSLFDSFGTSFRLSFSQQFTKASPVYWLDAGLADDPLTTGPNGYDPLKMGVDPHQLFGATGANNTAIPTYDDRPVDRELMTSKRGELTLAFDPNMRDSVGTIITVFRYDPEAKFWENLGGVVNVKANTITVPFDKFGYYVVGKMLYSFMDMTNHPYARNYLEAIYSKGIMNSAGYDTFGADMEVTRAEFARMIVKALNVPLNYTNGPLHFNDVDTIINPDALWDYRYVETAAREGIIRGSGPQSFSPTESLTREQAAVIIARALDLKLETDPTKIKKDLDKQFKDGGSFDFYSQSSVIAIAKKKFILGKPVDANNLKAGYVYEPKSQLLRSEAATIIARIMIDNKTLPKIN